MPKIKTFRTYGRRRNRRISIAHKEQPSSLQDPETVRNKNANHKLVEDSLISDSPVLTDDDFGQRLSRSSTSVSSSKRTMRPRGRHRNRRISISLREQYDNSSSEPEIAGRDRTSHSPEEESFFTSHIAPKDDFSRLLSHSLRKYETNKQSYVFNTSSSPESPKLFGSPDSDNILFCSLRRSSDGMTDTDSPFPKTVPVKWNVSVSQEVEMNNCKGRRKVKRLKARRIVKKNSDIVPPSGVKNKTPQIDWNEIENYSLVVEKERPRASEKTQSPVAVSPTALEKLRSVFCHVPNHNRTVNPSISLFPQTASANPSPIRGIHPKANYTSTLSSAENTPEFSRCSAVQKVIDIKTSTPFVSSAARHYRPAAPEKHSPLSHENSLHVKNATSKITESLAATSECLSRMLNLSHHIMSDQMNIITSASNQNSPIKRVNSSPKSENNMTNSMFRSRACNSNDVSKPFRGTLLASERVTDIFSSAETSASEISFLQGKTVSDVSSVGIRESYSLNMNKNLQERFRHMLPPNSHENSLKLQPCSRENSLKHQPCSRENSLKDQPWSRENSLKHQPCSRENSLKHQPCSRENSFKAGETDHRSLIADLRKSAHRMSLSYMKKTSEPSTPVPHSSQSSALTKAYTSTDWPGVVKPCLITVTPLKAQAVAPTQRLAYGNDDSEKIECTEEDQVLELCSQEKPITFSKAFNPKILKNCKKIGEGVYGEVFRLNHEDGSRTALKLIPVEGDFEVNGETQKSFAEILPEIVITKELSNLSGMFHNSTPNFIKVKKVMCLKGKYPPELLQEWDKYNFAKESLNDRPDIYQNKQLFISLECADGGTDLESMQLKNANEAVGIFIQVACTLAIAEQAVQFEHRDLHWGNILVSQCTETKIEYTLNGQDFHVNTEGVFASIIDFTLSRLGKDGCVVYTDLSQDPTLFTGEGDYQFDVYRLTKDHNKNDWESFMPYSNVLWLHYLVDKLINEKEYKNKLSKKHKLAKRQLLQWKDTLLQHKSATDFVVSSGIMSSNKHFGQSSTDASGKEISASETQQRKPLRERKGSVNVTLEGKAKKGTSLSAAKLKKTSKFIASKKIIPASRAVRGSVRKGKNPIQMTLRAFNLRL